MHWHYTSYAIHPIIATLVATALSYYVWRRRSGDESITFAWLMLSAGAWSLCYALELLSSTLAAKIFWSNVAFAFYAAISVLWLVFSLQYAGRKAWLTRRRCVLLCIEPLLISLLLWTNNAHHLIYSAVQLRMVGGIDRLQFTRAPIFWLHFLYSYSLTLVGVFLLLRVFSRSTHLYRIQISALLTCVLVTGGGNIAFNLGLIPIDITVFTFAFSGLAITWVVLRHQLLEVTPTARDAVFESMRDIVLVLDKKNRIVDLNPAAQKMLDPNTEFIGRLATDVLDADLFNYCRDVTGTQAEITLGKGEGTRYFDLRISPLHRQGNYVGLLVVLHDITKRRRAAQERTQLIKELDAFAHTVAHDLKNPLGIVLGYAEFLKDELDEVSHDELIQITRSIAWNSRKMDSIINELMVLAGVRKLRQVPSRPIDMAHVIDQTLQRLALVIEEAQAEVLCPDCETWPVALGYSPWVEEVWVNYLGNAIKYGGKPPRIELGATPQGANMVRFWVRDNGPGIPSSAQIELFTAFTRLEFTRAEGHGLGLSIVQRIVERLGGEVGVESNPEIEPGSTFYFTLPGKF